MHDAKASDYMNKHVHRVSKNSTVDKTLEFILSKRGSYAIVEDKDNMPIGIVTKKDIIKDIVLKKHKLNDKITKAVDTKLKTVKKDTTVREITKIMIQTGFSHIPIEENNKIIGIITEKELLEHTEVLHDYSARLAQFQNIQSYIIIAFFFVLFIIFLIKIF